MSEENKVIATGNLDLANEIVDSDAPDNERASVTEEDREVKLLDTFKHFAGEVRAAFPDVRVTVENLISEGDKVAARVTMRGTHLGEFQGIAPTDKRVQVSAFDVFHVAGKTLTVRQASGADAAELTRLW